MADDHLHPDDPGPGPGPDIDPRFAELAGLLRQGPSTVEDERPPAPLWANIAAALEADEPEEGATVTRLVRKQIGHRSRIAVGTAAVAAAVLVGVPLALAARSSSPSQTIVDLAALAGYDGSGQAELSGRELVVDVDGLKPVEGELYELWLLDLDNGELHDLVSLGTIDAHGEFKIGNDVDIDTYNVVDISLEAKDGNPAHSGVSVLRGEIPAQ